MLDPGRPPSPSRRDRASGLISLVANAYVSYRAHAHAREGEGTHPRRRADRIGAWPGAAANVCSAVAEGGELLG